MREYKIVKLHGASPEVMEMALNKRAKEGFYLEFVDSGLFILSKWTEDLTESEKEKLKGDQEDTEDWFIGDKITEVVA